MAKEHHWSGWPGAYCIDCGSDDPMENALADNLYDAWEGKWLTEEAKLQFEKDSICQVDFNERCPQCQANKNKK